MADLPNIERMLERQGRLWEIRRRMAEEAGEASMAHLSEGPWITVSREPGAGGVELARRLAHELGWQVFNHEILAAIAENTRTREAVLSRLDETAIGPLNEYLGELLDPHLLGRRIPFLQEMLKVIWGLAKQGNAVIVGRGANWFLDPRYGLRVRTVAPLERRVARLARQEGLGEAEARRRVQQTQTTQEAFIRQVYERRIDDPCGYDLVLNLETLGMDIAVHTVLAALQRRLGLTQQPAHA